MLSIVVPAYNESDSIVHTIEQIRATMDATGMVYEIIVVNDGSKDDTAARATTTGVKVISHPTNGGYGRALKTGILSSEYDWCAIVDADASYPINRLPDLLAFIPAFDMVVGARTGKYYWGSWSKRWSRVVLLRVVEFVVGRPVPDVNSGFRVFRKSVMLAHIRRISSGFSFTTTLTLAMFLDEHFIKYVPIDYLKRSGDSKVRIRQDSLRMLQIVTQAILYYNPLKLFLLVCLLCLVIGVVAALVSLLFAPALAWGIFILSIFVAILVGALGFIAESIRLSRLT